MSSSLFLQTQEAAPLEPLFGDRDSDRDELKKTRPEPGIA
jgi:hypothetical protein